MTQEDLGLVLQAMDVDNNELISFPDFQAFLKGKWKAGLRLSASLSNGDMLSNICEHLSKMAVHHLPQYGNSLAAILEEVFVFTSVLHAWAPVSYS